MPVKTHPFNYSHIITIDHQAFTQQKKKKEHILSINTHLVIHYILGAQREFVSLEFMAKFRRLTAGSEVMRESDSGSVRGGARTGGQGLQDGILKMDTSSFLWMMEGRSGGKTFSMRTKREMCSMKQQKVRLKK